jgi:DNA mismatch repair protein MLH3
MVRQLISEDELQDVIKGFLARLDSEGTSYGPPKEDSNTVHVKEAHRWMKALRWCPKELLDLINSKACRGGFK